MCQREKIRFSIFCTWRKPRNLILCKQKGVILFRWNIVHFVALLVLIVFYDIQIFPLSSHRLMIQKSKAGSVFTICWSHFRSLSGVPSNPMNEVISFQFHMKGFSGYYAWSTVSTKDSATRVSFLTFFILHLDLQDASKTWRGEQFWMSKFSRMK